MRKNTYMHRFFCFAALALLLACNPAEDDSYSLGGEIVALPANWTVTVTDNDNEVIVEYAPLGDFIDGKKILAVQFSCPEAGISFVVKKDDLVEPKSAKVYRSGDYVLYAAAITRAGAGTPKAVPFTVEKNLLLETLSEGVLPETVEFTIDDDGQHKETFRKGELYIESSSLIALAGEMANDEVIVNLDFFSRENTGSVKFLGESGVYTVYWNSVRKNVIIEPTVSIEATNGYYVLTGVGIGYPTTVSSDAIKSTYGGSGDGRYTTSWNPGANIRSRVVMRQIGTDTYQATVCINDGAGFKPFSNTGWGNDVFGAENCTFSGSPIFNESGDWSPNANCDKNAYYRLTLNAAQKAVEVRKVSATGEIEPDDIIPDDPTLPVVDDPTTINLSIFENKTVNGQVMGVYTKTLEKDTSYNIAGNFDDAGALFNPDFFNRTSAGSVTFLGETGEYTLYYYKAGKTLLIAPAAINHPDYLVATGKGFGYPVGTGTPVYIDGYPQTATASDILQYVLFRKIVDQTYQATIMMKTGATDVELKPYHAASGSNVTNNWGNGGEYNYDKCTFSGESDIFTDGGGDYHNWVAGTNASATQPYRITVTITGDNPKTADVTISKYTLP
jgi:hypothetical protein